MAAITIRQLDEVTKKRLRMRAAANGRSMEAEVRDILRAALAAPSRADLTWIEQIIEVANDVGGVELNIPVDDEATAADLSEAPRPR